MIRTILVGLDGSESAQRACGWAADLARTVDAEVVAATVVDMGSRFAALTPDTAIIMPRVEELEEAVEQDLCAALTQPLRDAGIRYRTRVGVGPPGASLVRMADEEHADLIIIGSRELSPLQKLLMGSVGQTLTREGHCPVIIIPGRATASEAARIGA